MGKVTISEADKASPYYKYYEREMAAVPAEKYKLLEEPMDSSKALKLTDINRLLEDGYLPGEYGFCRLEDDTLMIANCTQMPGCTVEMVDWWFAWHGVEPMRYIIWNPEEHYYCKTRNMEQALDQSLSMKERYWGTVHDVTEDMGGGPQKIQIHFRRPEEIGFDAEKLKAFDGTIICAADEMAPCVMCHFVRKTEKGVEVRTRFWLGWHMADGRLEKTLMPPPKMIPDFMAKGLLKHNIREFTNLAAILPELYGEFAGMDS